MFGKLREIFKTTKQVSLIKRFIDNPDKFILTATVINDNIMIQIKPKHEEPK